MRAMLIAICALGALTAQAQDANFLPGYEDLPLPPGFVASPTQSLVFDAPSGRIVEAAAAGPGAVQDARRFFDESLPAFGWAPSGPGVWLRGAERLSIEIGPAPGGAAASIRIRPARGRDGGG